MYSGGIRHDGVLNRSLLKFFKQQTFMKKLIECVPNFSEGRDMGVIKQITDAIEAVEGVKLLDVDPGAATNRTVVTFVGEPAAVIEGAFQGIKKAYEVIDMAKHSGEHPRFGATDVCPLIPLSNVTMEETVEYAHQLGKRVGEELGLSGYFYESAATKPERKNLATVRAGEYEGLPKKLAKEEWQPDYGPATFNPKYGVTAIGARDFLVAYNVNLNTTSTRRANAVAFDIREKGRVKKKGGFYSGEVVRDAEGKPVRVPGMLKACKAIGWFIEEYGMAQVSMNLTNITTTSVHQAFEACVKSATKRGMRVTGSELVGLVPLNSMVEAGKYFLRKQKRSVGVSELELVKIAVKSMGLDELAPFDPQQKIIEYQLNDAQSQPLIHMNLAAFADETASESPAPGGGSIAAYVGVLGVSLGTMVANLSSHKRGWDKRWAEFSEWAEKGQAYKEELLQLVDEDTAAFNKIMESIRMPKGSEAEQKARKKAMLAATINAIEVPFRVMQVSLASMEVMKAMAEIGNPNSASDSGVGALCARSAVMGAYLNVKINMSGMRNKVYVERMLLEGQVMVEKAQALEAEILALVEKAIA